MPTALLEIPASDSPSDPLQKVWTRVECEILETSGLLEGQNYELVDGELINKMGKNRPHVISLILLQAWMVQTFGVLFVNPETPIDVAPEDNPTNEPQPDLLIFKQDSSMIRSRKPRPEDLWLVVEIAESTLSFDLKKKAALYARARIIEYWVLDVAGRKLIVHRDPVEGRYLSIAVFGENECVAPLGAPNSPFRVANAFPKHA